MRITALAALLSVLVAMGSILLLIALPGPGVDRGAVDGQTGRVLSQPEAILARALASGDAAVALQVLVEGGEFAALAADQHNLLLQLRAEFAAPALPATTGLTPVEQLFAGNGLGADPNAIDRRAALAAVRWHDDADSVPVADLRAMAMHFAEAGRPRARDRWLLRAIAAAPGDAAIRMQAATAWIAERRLAEANAILVDCRPSAGDTVAYWTLRSDLARWLGDQPAEAAALAQLVAHDRDAAAAARLIEVQLARGDRVAAALAAGHLADLTHTAADGDQAADLLFAAGLANEGFALLQRRIATDDDPQAARRRLAAVLQQDLRFDEAQRVLETIVQKGGDDSDVAALEGLYRRLDLRGPLIALLQQHVLRDAQTSFDLLHLLAAQDRAAEAGRLLVRLFAEVEDPLQFFRLVPWFADAGVADLPATTARFADMLEPEHLQLALDAMAVPGFDRTPALLVLTRRFPDQPAVWKSRVAVVWELGDSQPLLALPAARQLALERPHEADAAAMWVTFAERYGTPDEQLEARRQLATASPGDHRNRRLLAELLTKLERHDDAMLVLEQLLADGDRAAFGPLLHGLARAGRTADMRVLLDDCVEDGPAALIEAADVLFADDVHTTALELYLRAIELAPDHPHATLRAGMLLGWNNRPNEALPLLERAAANPAVERFAVAFHLAEVQWALSQYDDARANYATVVEHRDDQPATQLTGAMVARSLHRTGRLQDALDVYQGLQHGPVIPTSTLLDLAELYVDLDDDEGLVATFAEVQRRDPNERRLFHLQAQRLMRLGDQTGARDLLLRIAEREELNGGELSDLGLTYEWAGEFGAALATYRRWAAMHGAREAMAAEQRMADRLAVHVGLQGSWRRIGDDTTVEGAVLAALTIDERTRVQGRFGYGEYRGRSQAVGAGATDVVARTALVDVGVAHRHGGGQDQIGAGLRLHPDAPGDRTIGAWIEHNWQSDVPAWSVSLRGALDELWTEPAAAPGLEGRTSSLVLSGYHQIGDTNWVNGEVGYRRLSARAPGASMLRDDNLVANVQIGHRWTDGAIAVTDPFQAHRAPAGPESPYLGHGAHERGDLHLSTWLGFTADHILDNAALTTILPLSERVHFLYIASRADRRLASGLGVSLDGLVGKDFEENTTSWEVAGALTWRPGFAFECDGRVGFGDAFGRPGFDSRTLFARLEGVLRW